MSKVLVIAVVERDPQGRLFDPALQGIVLHVDSNFESDRALLQELEDGDALSIGAEQLRSMLVERGVGAVRQ